MKTRKIALLMGTIITSTNLLFAQPAFASSQNPIALNNETTIGTEWEAENTTETVEIEGVNYTYFYHYENGNKTVTITNSSNDTVEKVMIDEFSNIYLNDELASKAPEPINDNEKNELKTSLARASWQTIGTPSKSYISWGKATSTGALAAMIAAKVSGMGPVGAIASIGLGGLSVIIASSAGGTVYCSIQMYKAFLCAPQYRSVWGFKAGTGDYYGDFYYHWINK